MAGARSAASADRSDWRLILGGIAADGGLAARGAVNMAVDEALLETVRSDGRPALRFYTWSPACLSLGRNQRGVGVYDATRATAAGINIVRRPTGGLAVLHDRELTYCLLAPAEPFGGPRSAYRRVNAALVEGLREMGVPAEQAVGGPSRGPVRDTFEPCFQSPAAGEVVAHGRKLVGSAQRSERGAILQHGSILLSGSQSRVTDLLTIAAPATNGNSITMRDVLGDEPSPDPLIHAICTGFERVFGIRLAPGALTRQERASVDRLSARYDATDWTWRR